ncbi:BgTH12-03553 [Blumeria graminis f. sp. triticale]|nr:BgTH12-03553 [Blumeria graminis f. sp. triticale]
MGLEWYH